jgi:hypothetical protein
MLASTVIPSQKIKDWLEANSYKPVLTYEEENMPYNMYCVTEYSAPSDEYIEEAAVQIFHRSTDYNKGYTNLNNVKKGLLNSDFAGDITIKSGVTPLTKGKNKYYDFSLNIILFKEVL